MHSSHLQRRNPSDMARQPGGHQGAQAPACLLGLMARGPVTNHRKQKTGDSSPDEPGCWCPEVGKCGWEEGRQWTGVKAHILGSQLGNGEKGEGGTFPWVLLLALLHLKLFAKQVHEGSREVAPRSRWGHCGGEEGSLLGGGGSWGWDNFLSICRMMSKSHHLSVGHIPPVIGGLDWATVGSGV